MKVVIVWIIIISLLVYTCNAGGASGVWKASASLFKVLFGIGVTILIIYVIGKTFTK